MSRTDENYEEWRNEERKAEKSRNPPNPNNFYEHIRKSPFASTLISYALSTLIISSAYYSGKSLAGNLIQNTFSQSIERDKNNRSYQTSNE